jgi:hypothetical protein
MSARRHHSGTPRRDTPSAFGHDRAPEPGVYTRIINGHNDTGMPSAWGSVFVVVLGVSRVPTTVVHVVDMIPVRDGDMAAPLTVDMLMLLVHRVAGWLAFVVVIPVLPMKVAVVREVDVVPVGNGDMAASFAVHMIMFDVGGVGCAGHCISRRNGFSLTDCWRTRNPSDPG